VSTSQGWRRQGRHEDRANLLRRKTVEESARVHPQCPCHRRWRCQGRRKGQASLLWRNTVGESASQHGRQERLLDIDPLNQVTSEWCQSRGRCRGAMRCSRRGRERRWWWCRCRSHHSRRRCGFRGCRAVIVVTTIVASGRHRPSEVVAQHTKGRRSSLGRWHS
jgi:hypothetical protein